MPRAQSPGRRGPLASLTSLATTIVDTALVVLALTTIIVVHTGYSVLDSLTGKTGRHARRPR